MAMNIDFTMVDINTKDIIVDELGQRDVNRRHEQFNKIMRTFNPNLVQPISVAHIDGKNYCVDGQMTMKVLKARNAGRDLCVKCRVYDCKTLMDAAYMFVNQRGTVSNVTLADKIRVMANYGDKQCIDFMRITENNGMNISWTGVKCKNSILAVSTLWNEFLAINDNALYAEFIRVLKKAWNGDPAGSQAQILKGLGLFVRTYKEKIKEDMLAEKLSKRRPNDIIRDAQADRSTGATKYAVQILRAYNYGLREEQRLPNVL